MRVVVLGGGSVGVQVAKELIREGKDVVLIERNADVAQHIAGNLDCLVVNEDGGNAQALKRAGTAGAEFFIALTGSDEVNMIASGLVAQQFPRTVKIARVRNPSYASFLQLKALPFVPVDHVIDPERETAQSIVRAVDRGAAGQLIAVGNQSLTLQPFLVDEASPLAGLSIAEVRRLHQGEFLVPLVLRDVEAIIPDGQTSLLPGDSVYFLGSTATLADLFRGLGEEAAEIHRLALFGGGRIASYVLEQLAEPRSKRLRPVRALLQRLRPREPASITVFEQNIDKCKALAERFPRLRVQHADVSEEETLLDEQLSSYDLAAALTGNQELNLVTAVQAKLLGVRRSLALVIKTDYLRLARSMRIDVTVSLKGTVVRSILAITRRGPMSLVHAISEADLEILELLVDESSRLAGKRLSAGELPRESLVLYVLRADTTLLPRGDLTVERGDRLGILTRKRFIGKLEARFGSQP